MSGAGRRGRAPGGGNSPPSGGYAVSETGRRGSVSPDPPGQNRAMADFALQAQPQDAADWLDLARRAEAAGFDTLLAADHPGSCAAPFVALAAAAAVTTTIRLGSYVSNAA